MEHRPKLFLFPAPLPKAGPLLHRRGFSELSAEAGPDRKAGPRRPRELSLRALYRIKFPGESSPAYLLLPRTILLSIGRALRAHPCRSPSLRGASRSKDRARGLPFPYILRE